MNYFLKSRPHATPFIISYGIEALILQGLEKLKAPDSNTLTVTDAQLGPLVFEAFSEVYEPKAVKTHMTQIMGVVSEHLRTLAEKAAKSPIKAADRPGPKPTKTFGSGFNAWLDGMDPSGLCLYLADFDPEKAMHYYWRVSKQDVEYAAKAKVGHEWERVMVGFESVMYGFGGSYKDDQKADPGTNVIDLTNGVSAKDVKASLAAFGF